MGGGIIVQCFVASGGITLQPAPKAGAEPKGEAADFIAFVFCFLFFCVFSPKIACQAPKPLNPLPSNNIHVAF
jgi:hypothetical protein